MDGRTLRPYHFRTDGVVTVSEREPNNEGYIDRQPLQRFEADMYYAASFYDLYNAFTTYLRAQFGIPEEAAMQLYAAVAEQLPGVELFDADPETAQAQMRLGLIRVALPLAEDDFGSHDDFGGWIRDAAQAAMDTTHSAHDVDECVTAPRGFTGFGCGHSDNCPVKVVKYVLIEDSMRPDFQSLDYQASWANEKVQRTIAKLNAAQSLGLIVGHEASTVRNNYLLRVKTHTALTPENGDI